MGGELETTGNTQVKKYDFKSEFCLFTCKSSRNQDSHDWGSSAGNGADNDVGIGVDIGGGRDPGKSPEKKPILCHCIGQLRHDKHDTQKAGRENGNV